MPFQGLLKVFLNVFKKGHCRETGISIEKQYPVILRPMPNKHWGIASRRHAKAVNIIKQLLF